MSDKTWGERAGDAWDLVADIVRFLFVMAVVLSPVAGVAYCLVNHISFDDISRQVRRLIDDGKGDEVDFVKAMHDNTAFNRFTAAEMLDMGHKSCEWLRGGFGPEDMITWMDQKPGMADFPSDLRRKVELDLITNSQIYLCPDTLHNGMASTPTSTTTAPRVTTGPTTTTTATTSTTTPPSTATSSVSPARADTPLTAFCADNAAELRRTSHEMGLDPAKWASDPQNLARFGFQDAGDIDTLYHMVIDSGAPNIRSHWSNETGAIEWRCSGQ